ncbi:MAG: hypothetical protein KC635_24690, partial [Myxococcales bacterium]|nr:hypothetical protein [Myxococcales bacterium]
MRTTAAALGVALTLTAAPALAGEPVTPPEIGLEDLLRHGDFSPSALVREAFGATIRGRVAEPRVRKASPAPITVSGEIIVLEGDSTTVSDLGSGRYGVRIDDQVQNLPVIVDRVLSEYGDEFDFVAVWTDFWDYGADGLAYYIGARNDVRGLGQEVYDQSRFWGSGPNGRLKGVLNMKSIDVYGGIGNPNNFIYPVMGQEMSHRWLAFMLFDDGGVASNGMLGRDEAHWNVLMDTGGSVQDGHAWRDNGDGTFTVTGKNLNYSPLDLYGMGLYDASEVPPWFLIENATYQGRALGKTQELPTGLKARGTRKDITIEQVISANGTRRPDRAGSQNEFRIAYVLITAPGTSIDEVGGTVSQIATFSGIWEQKFSEWTHGRATLCSRVTADCDRPKLALTGAQVTELEGDGDGALEPGEKAAIRVTVKNTGGGPAAAPRVHLVAPEGVDLAVENTPLFFPELAAGATTTLEEPFVVTIGADAPCGATQTLQLELVTGDLLSVGRVKLPIGYDDLFYDTFEEDLGWIVDADATDDAASGQWERDRPDGVNASQVGVDFQTQPDAGADDDSALVTGAQAGSDIGSFDVDGGKTTAWSPLIALDGAVDPHLAYQTWRTGLDFNAGNRQVLPDDNDPLTVELSPDNGTTWILVEEDRTNEGAWRQKDFRLRDLVDPLPASIVLRVTARDEEPQSL